MKTQTISKINQINRKFYQKTAVSFHRSRQYPWAGWEKVLQAITPYIEKKEQIDVLDLACGNGRLGLYLHKKITNQIHYYGLDNNKALLDEAKKSLQKTDLNWQLKNINIVKYLMENKIIFENNYDLIFMFGFWHHIPSLGLRKKLLENVKKALKKDGLLVITFWQFADLARFREKFIPGKNLGLAGELEKGDYFLGWQDKNVARFAHHTNPQQAKEICQKAGFKIFEDFLSDGKNNQLNYYLVLSG